MSFSRDWDLKQRVVNFLRQKNVLRRENVRVDVTEGLVTLHGHVRSYYEKQLLISACRRVAGVISIIDEVTVLSDQFDAADRSQERTAVSV